MLQPPPKRQLDPQLVRQTRLKPVNDLENQLNLLSQSWHADTQALWTQAQNRWNQKMTDAGRTIGMLSGHLDYAHETWHGAEHTNMGIWS